MVQPKQPPVSIRISDDLKARVAEWANKRKVTRNAAYAQLLEAGLKADQPKPAPKPKSAVVKAAEVAFCRPNPIVTKFAGVTASGEPLPVRKPIPKKGK